LSHLLLRPHIDERNHDIRAKVLGVVTDDVSAVRMRMARIHDVRPELG